MDHQLTQEEYLLIEAYLLGNLDDEALASFEIRLQNEAWLQTEVDAFQELYAGVKQFHTQQVLTSLSAKLEAEGFFLDEQSIEQYHLGALSPELIPIFEKRRAEDPTFARQIEEFEAMIKGLQGFQEESEIRSILANVEANLEEKVVFEEAIDSNPTTVLSPPEPRIKPLKLYRLAIAASIILVMGFGLWSLLRKSSLDIGIYVQNVSLPEGALLDGVQRSLLEMGGPGEEDMVYQAVALDDALEYYDKGSFDTAYQHLKSYIAEFPKDNTGQFYLGIASLHKGDYQRAEKAFQLLMLHPKSKFFESTKWFLAVTQLKTNPEQGKQRIKAIANEKTSPYWEKAQRIVRRYRLK
jgi:anti-sigma-K factor RskA